MTVPKQILALVLACALVLALWQGGWASQVAQSASPPATQPGLATQPASEPPEQLQQLVAPIALYPDALIAQILAASPTRPDCRSGSGDAQTGARRRHLKEHATTNGDDAGPDDHR